MMLNFQLWFQKKAMNLALTVKYYCLGRLSSISIFLRFTSIADLASVLTAFTCLSTSQNLRGTRRFTNADAYFTAPSALVTLKPLAALNDMNVKPYQRN